MKRTYFRRYEEQLQSRGVKSIAGFDEAGRGCLAGPLSMAAVVYAPILKRAKGLNDSKLIGRSKREELFSWITKRMIWAHTFLDVKLIDQQGLTAAVYAGFERLITDLEHKMEQRLEYVLMDGKQRWQLLYPNESIIGGDSKIRSIAAASIIAKVKRDRLMELLAKEYPQFGFDQHKGYGTRQHLSNLKKHGASPLHRISFSPVKELC